MRFRLSLIVLIALPWLLLAQQPKGPRPAAIRLPSGSIIVVTDNPADLASKTGGVLLSPEKYREISEQLELLKKQLTNKPILPTSCEIEGRIEMRGRQPVARLRISYRYRTSEANKSVFLSGRNAHPSEARLEDGKLPLLSSSEAGLTVLVESPGEYTLRVEMEVAVVTRGIRGNELGLELGLPGSPITTLSLALPEKVREVTLTRRELTGMLPNVERRRIPAARIQPDKSEPLGPITSLDLSWENPEPDASDSTRSADADIRVRIADTETDTEARIILSGRAKEWKVVAPPTAEFSVSRSPGRTENPVPELPLDPAPTIVRPDGGSTSWKIQFREPPTGDILVTIRSRTIRPRQTDPKAVFRQVVGPFSVADTPRQSGTIRVTVPAHLRLTDIRRGETRRPEISENAAGDLSWRFSYPALPAGPNNTFLAPVDLEIRPATTLLQSRINHFLTLTESGWRLRAEIIITPVRTETDRIEIEIPNELQNLIASPAQLVEGLVPVRDLSPQRKLYQIRLSSPRKEPFTINLEGTWLVPSGISEISLPLARLAGTLERDSLISVSLPETLELRGQVRLWENDRPGSWTIPLEISTSTTDSAPTWIAKVSRPPAQIDLSWRTVRLEGRAENVVDVTLGDRQARVTQSLRLLFNERVPRRFRLRGSPIPGLVVSPGSLENPAPGEWFLLLPPGTPRDSTVVFSQSLPDTMAKLSILMVLPEGLQGVESRVRVWRENGAASRRLPEVNDPDWREVPPEVVPERDSLPLLTVSGMGQELPLEFRDVSESPSSRVWAERGLIQIQPGDNFWRFRSRWILNRWQARTLEIDLPASAVDVECLLGGKACEFREGPSPGGPERVVRISLPVWKSGQNQALELRWQTPGSESLPSLVRWPAPKIHGNVSTASVRWQLALPSRFLPLSWTEGLNFEDQWSWKQGLPILQGIRSTTELERWLASGQEPNTDSTGWEMGDSVTSIRGTADDTLRLILLPRGLFVVVVSLLVLSFGWVLSLLRTRLVWAILTIVLLVGIIPALRLRQAAETFLIASLPGLAILILLLLIQRFRQWRYDRRRRFMPGFSRSQPISSLVKSSLPRSSPVGPVVPPVIPSTVDNPIVQPGDKLTGSVR